MATSLLHTLPPVPAAEASSKKRGELAFHLLLLFAALVVGAGLMVIGPPWCGLVFSQVNVDSLAGVVALWLALVVSIVAHELGHLLAAISLNYAVLGCALGPLRFERWNKKTIVRLARRHWSRCSVSAAPRDVDKNWRIRMMTVVVAGPVFSLLFLIATAYLAVSGQTVPGTWFRAFWSSCAEVNVFFVLLGLVPNGRFAKTRNDASIFMILCHNAEDAVDIFKCHQAIELSLRGIGPEEYPEPLLSELASFPGRPFTRLMVARRMVEWAVASGNFALADVWDQAALLAGQHCSPTAANWAVAESGCFDVLFRNDWSSAARKFETVELEELSPPPLAERAAAAKLIAGDLPRLSMARILLAQRQLPLGAWHKYERRLLSRLHATALSRSNAEALAMNTKRPLHMFDGPTVSSTGT